MIDGKVFLHGASLHSLRLYHQSDTKSSEKERTITRATDLTCRTIRETDLLASICVQMGWEQVSEERLGEIEMVMVSDDGVEIVRSTLSISA